jgi:hypothetical protein
MSVKKWVQLSDIHFGSPDSFNIEIMRGRFLEKCSQLHEIDYLFLTGDFRYGQAHPNDYPDGTIDFLQNVQRSLGISQDNTFMVPGNHDITHIGGREGTIEEIKGKYLLNRTIPHEYIKVLDIGRQQYLDLYEQICGTRRAENHFCISKEELNIIHINTAILCSRDNKDGSLFIDMLALNKALEGIDKTKPAITIAHHTFNCLDDIEQGYLEILLKDYNSILFLCGHKHFARRRNIQERRPNRDLWEYVCGTNMENPSQGEAAEIGFFTGEINTESRNGYVEAHKWSKRSQAWLPDSDFSFPQNGYLDGKYYFPERIGSSEDMLKLARNEYIDYLKYECYEISLDGLPLNSEVGSKTFALEKLFVPLRFSICRDLKELSSYSGHDYDNEEWLRWCEVAENPIPDEGNFQLAVLAGPGGGKTTWMKRLALAYGTDNLESVDDKLPKRPLFPIWIKCRRLGDDISLSILDIIRKIPEKARFALNIPLVQAFFELVSKHIKENTALVLIDGLDEIGNKSNRQAFVSNLNRFARMNKKVNIVMTSRISGYEHIARDLSIDFKRYRIQPFNQDDVIRLCVGLRQNIFGNTKEVTEEAQKLGYEIVNNEKIFQLAQTPVLLTTLLLINRRIGSLPIKRAALYWEAIEVLLKSWGSAVRLPIDLTEAIPQLAYLAHHMMFHSVARQTIGETELINVLSQARKDLQECFSTTSETVHQFIERVEDRSALLAKRGFSQKDNDSSQLEIEYEFQHLTFQEYLAAYAITRKFYPNATRESLVTDCLKNHLEKNNFKEVVLLTSVLTDKWGAEDIANALLKQLSDIREIRHVDRQNRITYITNLLMKIVADEAPLTPIMRKTIYKICFDGCPLAKTSLKGILEVYSSKYCEELQNIMKPFDESRKVKLFVPLFNLIELHKKPNFSIFTYWFENMNSEKISETLAIFNISTWFWDDWQEDPPENIQTIKESLVNLCEGEDEQITILSFSALSSLCMDEDIIYSGKLLRRLFKLSNVWQGGMYNAIMFPVTKDTVLHIQGESLSSIQKGNLKKYMSEENNSYRLLGYFWFGILFGAWDLATVIQMAKELSKADYISEYRSEELFRRMHSYLSILQESNAIPPESEGLVKEYLDELEQQKQAEKKDDIFDW